MIGTAVFFVALAYAVLVDIRRNMIPTLCYPLLTASAVIYIAVYGGGIVHRIAGFFLVGGMLLCISMKAYLGGGDIKLCAFAALAAGLIPSLSALLIAALLGCAYMGIEQAVTKQPVKKPFAPFLAVGYCIIYLINF